MFNDVRAVRITITLAQRKLHRCGPIQIGERLRPLQNFQTFERTDALVIQSDCPKPKTSSIAHEIQL